VEEIEARTPLSSLVEKLKAEILVGKEQYLDATLHFKQAIRVSPFNFEYLYSLGSIYHNELKELALAIRNYSKYL
jgi:tetratricopeptide (TPR) repeat protein